MLCLYGRVLGIGVAEKEDLNVKNRHSKNNIKSSR